MTKGYKPDRAVTSEKIKLKIEQLLSDSQTEWIIGVLNWKREFKRRLPESRGWVRGFSKLVQKKEGLVRLYAIAISDETDTVLKKVYLCDNADQECKKLGVLEIMFSE